MKKIIISLSIISTLFFTSFAFAGVKTAQRVGEPETLYCLGGKVIYTFNAVLSSPGENIWSYDYVEIDPPVTRQKLLKALNEDSIELTDASDIDNENQVINTRLDQIGQWTWQEVDDHVDATFAGLSTAQKNSLKTLYKCVLALIKIR
jgi:hypothetical protein